MIKLSPDTYRLHRKERTAISNYERATSGEIPSRGAGREKEEQEGNWMLGKESEKSECAERGKA